MAMTKKIVEIKFCKTCKKSFDYKKFCKANPFEKRPDKDKFF